MKRSLLTLLILFSAFMMFAEDGSKLWLRMDKVKKSAAIITKLHNNPTVSIAVGELKKYWKGGQVDLSLDDTLPYGDGFKIVYDAGNVRIMASKDIGLLYASYELLRRQQTGTLTSSSSAFNAPKFPIRILNHWDNPDGSIERGYAGGSLWPLDKVTVESLTNDARLDEYARANASIGINATVLNNVNASPKILSYQYLEKIKVMADKFRPYGIKVYLSVNFASPIILGKLKTADPLNSDVKSWWKNIIDEIYTIIPDFGGFLVKANSEGQPGPGDYYRTHADGANMLADALSSHHGIVMWRCFVYGNHTNEDRVKQAVDEFQPLDGQFRDNVILQAKNGPLDFQPREPYNPVFDRIHLSKKMVEFQITQEYLGQSKHLVYLAPMWKEFFKYVSPDSLKAVSGVSNIGDDVNWCGHPFSQANWYAFGRLAWNPSLSSRQIAKEWLQQTFTRDTTFVNTMTDVMETSRETCVNYMMPLGLHHIFKADHHYGPEPDGNQSNFPMEWRPVYYHKADSLGIGFDRTKTGSDAIAQYRHPYDSLYNKVSTCPEQYLLWFHHVSWNYKMKNGNTLWNNLVNSYYAGTDSVIEYIETWQKMKKYIDYQRWHEVDNLLHIQLENAEEWRDTCLKYFAGFSKQSPFRLNKKK